MRRFNYPQSIAAGTIAAGGTLGAMFPPSTVLVVYGIITEQDISKLFMAGIVPGLLAMVMYMTTLFLIGAFYPHLLPAGPRSSWRESEAWHSRKYGHRYCCSFSSSAAFTAACSRRRKPAAWGRVAPLSSAWPAAGCRVTTF